MEAASQGVALQRYSVTVVTVVTVVTIRVYHVSPPFIDYITIYILNRYI